MNTIIAKIDMILATTGLATTGTAIRAGPGIVPAVTASDQNVSGGAVVAERVVVAETGWLVVRRTDASNEPGAIVGIARLASGENVHVPAILLEKVASGEKLMLTIRSGKGRRKTDGFGSDWVAEGNGRPTPGSDHAMAVITAH